MIKRQLVYGVILAIAILAAGFTPVAAADFPYPKVAFSADMMMVLNSAASGQNIEMKGKIYSTKGKERREFSNFGHTTAIIEDREKQQILTLMPEQKMYMMDPNTKAQKNPETMIRDGELKMTPKGTEKINGQATTKYLIESMQAGQETFTGYAWLTQQNIPVRFKGAATLKNVRQEIEINYTNIVIAKQDPALFKVPEGFRPMPTGLGGMMGQGDEGISPEQIEQMKEMFKKQKRP